MLAISSSSGHEMAKYADGVSRGSRAGRKISSTAAPKRRSIKKSNSADSVPSMAFGSNKIFEASTTSIRRASRRAGATSHKEKRRASCCTVANSEGPVATAPTVLTLDESGHTPRNSDNSLNVSSTHSSRVAPSLPLSAPESDDSFASSVDLDFAICESILKSWGKAKSSSTCGRLGQTFLFHLADAEPRAPEMLGVDPFTPDIEFCESLITIMDDMTMLLGPMSDEETLEQLRCRFEQLKFNAALLAVLPQSFCSALMELLGDEDFTPEVATSWNKFLPWVASHKTFAAIS